MNWFWALGVENGEKSYSSAYISPIIRLYELSLVLILLYLVYLFHP